MNLFNKTLCLGENKYVFKDTFAEMISELSETKDNIFIYGAGIGAEKVKNILLENGIKTDGYVVDDNYINNHGTVPVSSVYSFNKLPKDKLCCLVVGFLGLSEEKEKAISAYPNIKKIYSFDFVGKYVIGDDTQLSQEFFDNNAIYLTKLYERFIDEESKKHFIAFLDQRAGCTYRKLRSQKPQYFDDDVISFGDNEVFVDCGAYDGDSILGFISHLKEKGINNYKKIYAFEADSNNIEKLQKNVSELPNIITIPKGVSDKKGILFFASEGTISSRISDSGIQVPITKIDDELNGESVTYIKMDIEGSEYNALFGAKETIIKNKPKLAICIYHKPEDIAVIPNFLLTLNPEYHFCIRNYHIEGIETVLYAM